MADSSPSRELLQRTLSGAVIVLGIIGGIYLGGTAWLCVVSALALVSLGEYYRLLAEQAVIFLQRDEGERGHDAEPGRSPQVDAADDPQDDEGAAQRAQKELAARA